jgi:hypothetical protein
LKVLQCGAGNGCRILAGPIMQKRVSIAQSQEERDIQHTIETKEVNWIGHTMCLNCLEKHIITEKIEGTRRTGRCQQLLADLNKNRVSEFKSRSTRSHSLENSLWKRLKT